MDILIKVKIGKEVVAERYIEVDDCELDECQDQQGRDDCISDEVADWKRHYIRCDWEILE